MAVLHKAPYQACKNTHIRAEYLAACNIDFAGNGKVPDSCRVAGSADIAEKTYIGEGVVGNLKACNLIAVAVEYAAEPS